jgi:peptidoglycan/xylan/chitin deacetylase (PgdA/CDA1 family)
LTVFHLINRVGWVQTDDFSLAEGDGAETPQPTPPTININSPTANTTVSGIVNISADASDNLGMAGVQFKIDGVNLGAEDTQAPYTITWDTFASGNGSHQIAAIARNASGLTTSDSEQVDVQNSTPTPPAISFLNPPANSTLSGTQNITVSASSDTAGVLFKLDGNSLAAEDVSAPFSISLDTSSVANGSHQLSATARNSAGLTTIVTESVIVQNNVSQPPAVNNLVANPSLESSSNGEAPDSWQTSAWGTNTSTFTYLGSGHTGNHSVKVETTSYGSGAANWYNSSVPIIAGKTYKYENWYQSNAATEVDAEVVMSDGSTQYFWLGDVTPSTSWNKFSATFTAPADAKSMTVYHLLAAKGYLIDDDYSLTEYLPESFNRALVSVTFDDGWASQYQNALPILNKYGIKATFYIISGEMNDTPDYMSTAQIQNLYSQGMEIGSHTITHTDLTGVSQSKLIQEMSQSQIALQNAIGAPVVNFAYPYGAYNANTVSAGQQYYQSQRTVNQGYNSKDNLNLTQLKIYEVDSNIPPAQVQEWIQGAIDQKSWLILVYHEVGTSIGGDIYHVSTNNLDANMSYLKNSGVAVVTVNQAINEVLSQL